MRGTTQFFHPKIFVWEQGNGIRLYEQRPLDLVSATPAQPCPERQFYSLDAVEVSADGGTVAVEGSRPYIFPCSAQEQYQTTLHGAGAVTTMPGGAVISRNGRYAALFSSIGSQNASGVESIPVVDLQTGKQTMYFGWGVGSRVLGSTSSWINHRLANDGTLLLNNASGLVLARGAEITVLGLPTIYGWINDAGTVVLYATYSQLFSFSVATHGSVLLANESPFSVVAADDGSMVAFEHDPNAPQVFVIRSDGTGLRQLTNFAGGASPVAMSGDGKVVFAAVYDSPARGAFHLARIDVASGNSTDIVPPTPILWVSGPWPAEPGVLATVAGTGIAADAANAAPPLPSTLGGIEMRINGSPAPLLSVLPGNGSVTFQIPWDLPAGISDAELAAGYSGASPFVAGLELLRAPPAFYLRMDTSTRRATFGSPIVTAAHDDWHGLVSDADPARPGEVLHLYAQGIGPVTPAPADGDVSPSQPPSALALPMVCLLNTQTFDLAFAGAPVDLLFAGLAPQMFGVYQVDVRMPAALQNPGVVQGSVACRIGDAGSAIAGYLPIRMP